MKGLNRRIFLVVWLGTLFYLLYLALWKATTSRGVSDVTGPTALAAFEGTQPASTMPTSGGFTHGNDGGGSFGSSSSSVGTLPGSGPAVPMIFGMPADVSGGFGGAKLPPEKLHAVPAGPVTPTKCVDRTGGLPATTVHRHGAGQVCLTNVYVYEGKLYAELPPPGTPEAGEVRAYLDKEGLPSESFKEMTEEVRDGLLRAPLPSAPYVAFQLESPQPGTTLGDRDHILAQFYGFLEGAVNLLAMQALEAKRAEAEGGVAPTFFPAPILCCGCGPHLGGLGGLNLEISRGLWGGELHLCKGIAGNPPAPRPPALLAPCSPTSALLAGQHKAAGWPAPWAMHAELACMSDRSAAFSLDGRVEKWKNYFASLLPALGAREREVMEGFLGRVREYALSVLALEGQYDGVADELGTPIKPVLLDSDPASGPLVVVVQRPEGAHRGFPHIAQTTLAGFFKAGYTKRFLLVRTARFPALLQLAIAAKADLLVGTHGEDMGLLMFQPPGGGVVEIAPHYQHFDVEGSGWSNALSFLSRVKGSVYGAIDALRGPLDPNGRLAADMGYQMDLDVYVNTTGLGWEVDRVLKHMREVREAAAAGGGGEGEGAKEGKEGKEGKEEKEVKDEKKGKEGKEGKEGKGGKGKKEKKGKEGGKPKEGVTFWHPNFISELESFPGGAEKVNY